MVWCWIGFEVSDHHCLIQCGKTDAVKLLLVTDFDGWELMFGIELRTCLFQPHFQPFDLLQSNIYLILTLNSPWAHLPITCFRPPWVFLAAQPSIIFFKCFYANSLRNPYIRRMRWLRGSVWHWHIGEIILRDGFNCVCI